MSRSATQTPVFARKFGYKPINNPAGAVDEDFFYEYFTTIEAKEIHSTKDLQDVISDIISALKSNTEDWEKRIRALKLLQNCTVYASKLEDFVPLLRQLQIPLESCLTDLRSQIVREACITVAYLSHIMKLRLEQTADAILPHLLNLIPNSARVMSSSGMVCLSIIVMNIHSQKILIHILSAMTSKSNSTRRFSSKLLETICSTWDSAVLSKQLSALQSSLEKGLADADQEARASCRIAFAGFALNFPQEANVMLVHMDSGRRSLLEKELSNHPAGELLSSMNNNQKRRTSCPPSTLPLNTNKGPRTPNVRKTSVDPDEYSMNAAKPNYSSLNRPKPQTKRTNNIMSTSVSKTSDSSKTRGSNSSLSNYSYKSTTRTTPQTARRKDSSGSDSQSSNSKYESQSAYRYKPSGSVSASLPRRKNMGTKVMAYPPLENGFDLPSNNSRRKTTDSSDDNASESSSIESSEVSKSSLRAQRPTENVQEILRQLSSAHWSEKKDGLINFQNLMQGGRISATEMKKFVEIFNTLFSDTKSKIFPLFLLCVQLFIEVHKQSLSDWLYPLLLNLISKQASETMTSRQKPIQDTLSTIRSHFSLDLLVRDCCRIIAESYQNTSMKLKVSILAFFKTVIIVAPTNILENSLSSLAPTVNILIEWTLESKWQEVRKISSALLIKFHELHPQILDNASQCLSPVARQKLTNLLKHSSDGDANCRLKARETYASSHKMRSNSGTGPSVTQEDIDNYIRRNTEDLQALSVAYDRYDDRDPRGSYSKMRGFNQYRTQLSDPSCPDSTDQGVMNNAFLDSSGASYMINRYQSSIRNADFIQQTINPTNEGMDSRQDVYLHGQRNMMQNYGDPLSYSCYQSYDSGMYGYCPAANVTSTVSDQIYPDSISGIAGMDVYLQSQSPLAFQMLRKLSDMPPNDMLITILSELCNLNQRNDQRKACLLKMINIIREKSVDNWNDVFKAALMRLLETIKDNNAEIRCLALRVIQELTKYMSQRFDDFTHLTVLKVLQAHKDSDKTVVKAAEECSQILAKCLSHKLCIRVLSEMIKENDCRMNLGALKMLLEVLKNISEPLLLSSLEDIIPGVITTSEHDESHIRKASIFCLVEIYNRVGDRVWPFLSSLSSSKTRLLRLYIDKNRSSSRMSESTTILS